MTTNTFTAIVEVHRNGRPSGGAFAVQGNPDNETHPDNWRVKMDNWVLCGQFPTFEEAQAHAESLITVDDEGWTRWSE